MANIQELKNRNIAKRQIKIDKKVAKQKKIENKNIEMEKRFTSFSKHYSLEKTKKINLEIQKIAKKYDLKIKKIKNLFQKINLKYPDLEKKEKKKLKNASIIKYYQSRIDRIKRQYSNKIEKINYSFKIGKLTKEEAQEKIEKLRIDEGASYERWDSAIVERRNLTTKRKFEKKIKKLELSKREQIKNLENSLKTSTPTTNIKAIRDKWQIQKSKYIFGLEVRTILNNISKHIKKYSMFYVLASIIVFFAISTKGVSLGSANFVDNIIMNNTYIYIIGLGMLLVIIGGYIDLSVGTMMGFLGAISIMIFNMTENILATLLLTIMFGVGIGFINGILIGYFKMPAFIVTLGGMLLFSGLTLIVTKSETLTPISDIFGNSDYIKFVTGAMPDIKIGKFFLFSFLIVFTLGIGAVWLMIIGRTKKAKYGLVTDSKFSFITKTIFIISMFAIVAFFAGNSTFGLRYYLLYIMVLIALFIFITQNTSFGRKVYAIGGNKAAAELSGISVGRTTTYIFMIVGAMVGFASIIFTGVMTAASPQVASAGYELDVISSVFVGGASMAGGVGSVSGTFIGGLVLASIRNGFDLMSISAPMQSVIKAIVLLGAVGYDIYSNRKIG